MRPATGGPFTRAIREALETALSPTTAEQVLAEALHEGGLMTVPEEIGPFRRFCEGPFQKTVVRSLGPPAIEQIFERLGHVLWMATSDVSTLELAREWSRRSRDPNDDSGVRNVDGSKPAARAPSPTPPAPTHDSRPRARDTQPGIATEQVAVPRPPSASNPSIGRLRAPTLTRAATSPSDSRPRAATAELNLRPSRDPRSASVFPPPHPLENDPTPVRRSSAPPLMPGVSRNVPTAVLALTLDERLVADLRQSLANHCPVRAIGAATELVGALVTSGASVVIVIDTALPSIDVPTFAGLAPILPPGTRVVLWGATDRQKQRLVSMFPPAASWVPTNGAPSAGDFILALP